MSDSWGSTDHFKLTDGKERKCGRHILSRADITKRTEGQGVKR